uniref:NADH-ubiquinone oxidoreductase chain 5 n=2 Tax=Mirhipipteryx andensis TaxID=1564103 RepID=A0A0N7AXV7_9ORTH|nr:NADH dehydrogenase subunit 5 [Mirhipipteryx andensis]AJW76427.1 NADH dehydrogenase subunit 5 [Mirhipipteryx andensis]
MFMKNLCICYISSFMLMGFSLMCVVIGSYYICFDKVTIIEWEIFSFVGTEVVGTLLFDWMSLYFLGLVSLISSLVILYSAGYMENEVNLNRFIMLVLLFVFSMWALIISPNLIMILLGWDGLGLVSYCLVIYYQNVKSYNAGMLTALSNRIGDVALLMAITWMLNYGSWNFVYYFDYCGSDYSMMVVMIMVLLAGMTKSAQIPFSSWLPAAMAAPTPVSALVHSSTLVTAGVYLLIRFNKLLLVSGLSKFMLLIGSLTMLMAGLGAMQEFDLKSIIALSTLSQLGLMMGILSLGGWMLAFFHLLTHALFKALLFMCAGSIIHSVKDTQDIRFLGSMVQGMPFTCVAMNVANLSLCGVPFLSGFYSKDLILESLSMGVVNKFIYLIFFIATGLTMMYTFRLTGYLMGFKYSFNSLSSLHDSNSSMVVGIILLLVVAVVGGCSLSWLIFPSPLVIILPSWMKLLTLMVTLVGGWLSYLIMKFDLMENAFKGYKMKSFIGSMWFMPMISTKWISFMPLKLGLKYLQLVDLGWNEAIGSQGVYNQLTKQTSSLQSMSLYGNFKSYLLLFFLWVLTMMLIIFTLN